MVYRRSLWSLCSLLTVIALLNFAKSSIIANNTAVRSPDAGLNVMYTTLTTTTTAI